MTHCPNAGSMLVHRLWRPALNLPYLNVSRSSVRAPALNELWMNLPFVHSTDHCHLLLAIRQTIIMYVMSRTNLVRDIMYNLMAEYVYDELIYRYPQPWGNL